MRAVAIAVLLLTIGARADAQPVTAFQKCVARALPALDDQVSPANVIADGVVENCRETVREPGISREALEHAIASLKKRIIPDVLRYRAEARTVR